MLEQDLHVKKDLDATCRVGSDGIVNKSLIYKELREEARIFVTSPALTIMPTSRILRLRGWKCGRFIYIRCLNEQKRLIMAATTKNLRSMLKSRKHQSRKVRTFMASAKAFDGSHVSAEKKRAHKKRNFTLARKVRENYCLLG